MVFMQDSSSFAKLENSHIDLLERSGVYVDRISYINSLKQDIPNCDYLPNFHEVLNTGAKEIGDESIAQKQMTLLFELAEVDLCDKLEVFRNSSYEYLITYVSVMRNHYKKQKKLFFNFEVVSMCNQLLNEYFLWDLLYTLQMHKIHLQEDKRKIRNNSDNVDDDNDTMCDYNFVSFLYSNYPELQTAQIIVDWCERCYYVEKNLSLDWSNNFLDSPDPISYLKETVGDMRSKLVNIAEDLVEEGITQEEHKERFEKMICFRIDPDAPYVLKRPFHDVDNNYQSTLNKKLYEFIRSGMFNHAKKMLLEHKDFLKLSVIDGWKLERIENNERVEGNAFRHKWLEIAYAISNNKNYDIYERALYASFCNNPDVLFEVAETYRDNIWTHMKSFCDQMIAKSCKNLNLNEFIKSHICKLFNDDKIKYSDDGFLPIIKSIFMNLHEISNFDSGTENNFIREIKKSILEHYDTIGKHYTNRITQKHFLRVCTNLYLLLKNNDDDMNGFANLLTEYFNKLIKVNEIDIIPFYISVLPGKLQFKTFSLFFEKIKHVENKAEFLELMKKSELSIIEMMYLHVKASFDNINFKEVDVVVFDSIENTLNWFFICPNDKIFVIILLSEVSVRVINETYLDNEYFLTFFENVSKKIKDFSYENVDSNFDFSGSELNSIHTQYKLFCLIISITKKFNDWNNLFKQTDDNVEDENIRKNDEIFLKSKVLIEDLQAFISDEYILNKTLPGKEDFSEHISEPNSSTYRICFQKCLPYCLLSLSQLYTYTQQYSKMQELSDISCSLDYGRPIQYFRSNEATFFMSIISNATNELNM